MALPSQKATVQWREQKPQFYPFNPYTGQGYATFGRPGPMNFNLGTALQAALNQALPMHQINAPVSMARMNAQSTLGAAQARAMADRDIARINAQAALAREQMRNKTLGSILGMFSQTLRPPAFMPISTNYGAQASPQNYRPGVR